MIINGYDFKKILVLERIERKDLQGYRKRVEKHKEKYSRLVKPLEKANYDFNEAENIEFCEFRLKEKLTNGKGVYLWVIDGKIRYIGKTDDINKRFNSGYGHISPRNIFIHGQSTNCKMNIVALNCFENNKKIEIRFLPTTDTKEIEDKLLKFAKHKKWDLYNSRGVNE